MIGGRICSVAATTLITGLKPHREEVDTVSETTHQPEFLLAVEAESSGPDVRMSLADYRRLNDRQRAAVAAELKRKVEIEIAEQRQRSQARPLFRPKSALIAFIRSVFGRIGSADRSLTGIVDTRSQGIQKKASRGEAPAARPLGQLPLWPVLRKTWRRQAPGRPDRSRAL